MLNDDQVLAVCGKIPGEPWEWGHYPTPEGNVLTMAFPMEELIPGLDLIILEFIGISKPLRIDHDTSYKTLLDYEGCSICLSQTMLLLAARNVGNISIEKAFLQLMLSLPHPAMVLAIVTEVRTSEWMGDTRSNRGRQRTDD